MGQRGLDSDFFHQHVIVILEGGVDFVTSFWLGDSFVVQ